MSIRIAILGDIVGTPGRQALTQCMPALREQYQPHLVIANAENAANGSGLTPDLYKKICDAGVDAITLGDHVYKKKQIVSTLEQESNIIRPANLSPKAVGKPWMRLRIAQPGGNGPSVYVLTVLGRLFMNLPVNDPFATVDQILSQLPEKDPLVIVEVHAEATSEKKALGWHLNGRAAVVFGSHTHVPTADETILPPNIPHNARGGTAYITDIGMTGPQYSILGRRVDRVLTHMTTSMPSPFDVAEEKPTVQGILVELSAAARQALHIQRIQFEADVTKPPFAQP